MSQRKRKHLFEFIVGSRVSVLLDHFRPHSKLKESYVGLAASSQDGFLTIATIDNPRITHICINEKHIVSIWIHKDQSIQGNF
jgi:hypothetical protein